jgi:hypothetical protein
MRSTVDMALTAHVDVTDTATELYDNSSSDVAVNVKVRHFLADGGQSGPVYLGDSNVTTANGFFLHPRKLHDRWAETVVGLDAGQALYGICPTDRTAKVDVLQVDVAMLGYDPA